MHQNFADWYRAATFGHDGATLNLRWQGVEAILKELDFSVALELVRLAFGRPPASMENVERIRQHFKTADPTFSTSGNDHEVQVLAGCVLALLCIDNDYNRNEVPLAILTASACKTRVPKVEIDLVNMATDRVQHDGIRARNRTAMSKLKINSYKKVLDDAIAPFTTDQQVPNVSPALQQMVAAIENSIKSLQENTNNEIALLQKVLTVQDEELQMLWWMVGGWSEMWKSDFRNIDSKSRPILLAKEAARMTEMVSESPSLKSIFHHVGIGDSAEFPIHDAVNSCGVEHLKTLSPKNTPCPLIFPVHSAIVRALETGADKAWITPWSKISGIAKEARVVPLELALQFHRELKLMAVFETSNE